MPGDLYVHIHYVISEKDPSNHYVISVKIWIWKYNESLDESMLKIFGDAARSKYYSSVSFLYVQIIKSLVPSEKIRNGWRRRILM